MDENNKIPVTNQTPRPGNPLQNSPSIQANPANRVSTNTSPSTSTSTPSRITPPTQSSMPVKTKSAWPAVLISVILVAILGAGAFWWWTNVNKQEIVNDVDSKYATLSTKVDTLETEVNDLSEKVTGKTTTATDKETSTKDTSKDKSTTDTTKDSSSDSTTKDSNNTNSDSETSTEDKTTTTTTTTTDTTKESETNTDTNDDTTNDVTAWYDYISSEYGFSFSYPSEYKELAATTNWVYQTDLTVWTDELGTETRIYDDSITSLLSLSAETTTAKYYPTLKVNVFDLSTYAFSISPNYEFIYDSENKEWLKNDGTNLVATIPTTTSIAGSTGYNLRFDDMGNFYSIVAIPILDKNIMVEIGFSGSTETSNRAPGANILATFKLSN
ncbi:MAG: hypothetical protein ABIE68_04765 [bacterium]